MPKVLLVDDSATMRNALAAVLEAAGHQVVHARDGLEGAEAMAANQDVCLAFCDIHMPIMGGIEMLAHVGERDGRRCPVIILSSETAPDLLREARDAGAQGWMVKPFDAHAVLQLVRRYRPC